MVSVKKQRVSVEITFSEQVDKIKRVFDSCKTVEQLENANVWCHRLKRKYQPLLKEDSNIPNENRREIHNIRI